MVTKSALQPQLVQESKTQKLRDILGKSKTNYTYNSDEDTEKFGMKF